MYSRELLKGTLSAIILKLLADEERMYGYEISQRVKELTGGTTNASWLIAHSSQLFTNPEIYRSTLAAYSLKPAPLF